MNLGKINGVSESMFQPTGLPTEWTDKYNDAHKEKVNVVLEWLNTHQKPKTWLGTAASVNRTTAQLLLTGKYTGNVGHYLKILIDTIDHINARSNASEVPFHAQATVARLARAACARARKYNSFAVLSGDVGTGKTRSLEEYKEEHPNTVLIEAGPLMSPNALLDEIIEQCKIDFPLGYASREKKFTAIVDILKKIDMLIIVDEAETMSHSALHHLRRIRDKADVGVVLAGTPRLHSLISPVGGQFDQIRSRVCFWPKVVRQITKEDAKAVVTTAFEDMGELDDAVHNTLWHYTRGSMRMLAEQLIPAVRDYGLKKHNELTADVIHSVAQNVLSLTD